MSRLGYIENSYGKSFSVSVANTYSFNILGHEESLPSNTLIIASNVDEDNNDIGTYSLLMTDSYGTPIRLTYTLSEGNGLYYSSEDDYLSLRMDEKGIIYTENGLSLNLSEYLSDIFVPDVEKNSISINKDKIPISDYNTLGISYIDGKTILVDDGEIFANTSALTYSNNNTNEYGIAIGDGDSITVNNGIVSLNIEYISRADENLYGLSMADGVTVNSNNGELTVITSNLDRATTESKGISRPNANSLIIGNDSKLIVNTENLDTATNNSKGISKIDVNTLIINDNNRIEVKDYKYIISSLDKYKEEYLKYKEKLNDYIEYLSDGNILLKNKNIILFAINETSTIELDKPQENEEVINMPEQYVSAVFDIITTCDFILNINFEEGTNEFPMVDLFEVNYNDEVTYQKTDALNPDTVYKSTNGELKKFTIKFLAKNFRDSVKNSYIITGVNLIISNSEDHNKSLSQKYSIVRYNSVYVEEETTAWTEEYYILIQDSVMWQAVI